MLEKVLHKFQYDHSFYDVQKNKIVLMSVANLNSFTQIIIFNIYIFGNNR